MSVRKTEWKTLKSNLVAKLILTILGSSTLMWIDVLSWTHTSPPGLHSHNDPLSQSLPNTLREGDTNSISPISSICECVHLKYSSAEDRHRDTSRSNRSSKMSCTKWVKKNVNGSHPDPTTIGDSYWGFTAVEQGFDLCRFSRETHLHNIKTSPSPNTKKTRSLAREQQRPTNPKRRVFDISLC